MLLMDQRHTQRSHPFIAFLVCGWSIGWWQFLRQAEPESAIAIWIPVLLGSLGLYVAMLLWRGDQRAVGAYCGWAVADIVGLVIADLQVEPVAWRVVVGAFAAALILASIGLYLRLSGRTLAPSVPQS